MNENRPEKLHARIVFDCAASFGGTSMNKGYLQGPDFTKSVVGVSLRFRQDPVAVMGDLYRRNIPSGSSISEGP